MSVTTTIRCLVITALACCLCALPPCRAQVQLPNSYGQIYQTKLPSYAGASIPTSNRYLYDKYFYHNQAVSPYINLGRPGTDLGTSYQAYIRPEMERREANATAMRANIQQRKLQGNVGHTNYSNAINFTGMPAPGAAGSSMPQQTKPSAYYNHWYGGWSK